MIKELDEFVSISSSCLVKSYVSEDLLCEQNLALDLFFLRNQGLDIFTILYTTSNVVRRGISLTSGCSMCAIRLMLLKFTYQCSWYADIIFCCPHVCLVIAIS
jgi:hypothetical protein